MSKKCKLVYKDGKNAPNQEQKPTEELKWPVGLSKVNYYDEPIKSIEYDHLHRVSKIVTERVPIEHDPMCSTNVYEFAYYMDNKLMSSRCTTIQLKSHIPIVREVIFSPDGEQVLACSNTNVNYRHRIEFGGEPVHDNDGILKIPGKFNRIMYKESDDSPKEPKYEMFDENGRIVAEMFGKDISTYVYREANSQSTQLLGYTRAYDHTTLVATFEYTSGRSCKYCSITKNGKLQTEYFFECDQIGNFCHEINYDDGTDYWYDEGDVHYNPTTNHYPILPHSLGKRFNNEEEYLAYRRARIDDLAKKENDRHFPWSMMPPCMRGRGFFSGE